MNNYINNQTINTIMDEEKEEMFEELEGKTWHKPLRVIGGVFLLLLIIMMVVPKYGIKLDPEPKVRVGFDEVVDFKWEISNETHSVMNQGDFYKYVDGDDVVIKQVANKIFSLSCDSKICGMKAMFYFVRDNYKYVNDPVGVEYVQSARDSLFSRSGDCDDHAVLLASLLSAIGVQNKFVFTTNHVWVEARINDYKKGSWINLDATCKACRVGELGLI